MSYVICHTVVWDVQYGKVRVKYDTAYYMSTPYDASVMHIYFHVRIVWSLKSSQNRESGAVEGCDNMRCQKVKCHLRMVWSRHKDVKLGQWKDVRDNMRC
jgi:hypothetical protein